jgi:BirA family transcriptional regulator, biotin operon repressor / biotin---[acetyl-CoA-carboxylase] ligase
MLEPARLRLPPSVTQVEYHAVIDSTNDAARRRAAEVPRDAGLLIVADEQTAGRGRGANRWWTGAGSLAFSLLFDPARYDVALRYASMVPLAAAIAVVDVVTQHLPGPATGIHWPNDIFLGERKLAGVLVEGLPDGRQILGLGCNVNNPLSAAPPEVAKIVASLCDELGAPLDRTEFLSELLSALDVSLTRLGENFADVGRLADSLCLQNGKLLNVHLGEEVVSGICTGIADDGALQLDTPGGPRTLYSGVVLKT